MWVPYLSEDRSEQMPPLPSAIDHGTAFGSGSLVRRLRERLVGQVEAAFFWAAVVLPFLHLPLLLTGLETSSEAVTFTALLALNFVALVVGHRHQRD